MYILGISALYHDSAAALIHDGEILAAAQEERFTRVKHDKRLPHNAMKYCLKEANITSKELDYIVYYDNPLLTLDRFAKNALELGKDANELIDRSFDDLFQSKMWIHKDIEKVLGCLGKNEKLYVMNHHISHAASAFYPSPFEDAIIITNDGVGEWSTTTLGVGHGNKIELKKEIRYPHSLGLLYSAFTYFCGFKVNSGDYKFMGLAPYGSPIYYDLILEKLIDVKEDGSYALNMDYFDYQNGRTMINKRFEDLFGGSRRQPESTITKREMDIAASGQKVIEDILMCMARYAKNKWGLANSTNLVLAGGVALNCVANGRIKDTGIYNDIWIQPAAGDAGGALGCALYLYYNVLGYQRTVDRNDSQKGSYLGPSFKIDEIKRQLDCKNAVYEIEHNINAMNIKIAQLLSDGKVIGLCNGRMEYGPRALGNRSIIADPRRSDMQSKLNLKIKFRESFRPFAPSVLEENANEYFELKGNSPYMLLVEKAKSERRRNFKLQEYLERYDMDMLPVVNAVRSDIPAVTHVDFSARIQTVSEERNARYYHILKEFRKLTGCAVVVNTSFNVRGEPIVCTPAEAYECFMRTEIDILVIDNFILYKEKQPLFNEHIDWKKTYMLD